MKRKLVFATNNAHKLEEVAAILGDKVELLSLNDIDCHTDIPETAETLEGNALLKSSFIYRNYQLDCFADDTGLEVEALNGAPGVYSARYAEGEGHDAQANMRKLLHELEGKENRKAQFRTAISLILDGKEYLFEGVIKGKSSKRSAEIPASVMTRYSSPKGTNRLLPNWETKQRTRSVTVHWLYRNFASFCNADSLAYSAQQPVLTSTKCQQ